MEKNIIKMAVLYPYSYPWDRSINVKKAEVDKVLKDYGLETDAKRRIANFEMFNTIYINATESNSENQLFFKSKDDLKKRKYITDQTIRKAVKILNFDRQHDLGNFNNFLKCNLPEDLVVKKTMILTSWATDIAAQYYGRECSNIDEIMVITKTLLKRVLKGISADEKTIANSLRLKGYNDKGSLEILKMLDNDKFRETFRPFATLLEECVSLDSVKESCKKETINKDNKKENAMKSKNEKTLEGSIEELSEIFKVSPSSSEEEEDILGSIEDLFNEVEEDEINIENKLATLAILEEIEEIEEIEKAVEVEEVLIEEKMDDEKSSISLEEVKSDTIAEEKKCIAEDEESFVKISKDKYNSLLKGNTNKSMGILKELVQYKNGAVLSELYNAYEDIDNISRENLKAVLTNFFVNLNIQGVDVINDGIKIGDDIKVDTKNILKDFIFTESINQDGEVEGVIKYYGWSYNGKQITPMVVKPKK